MPLPEIPHEAAWGISALLSPERNGWRRRRWMLAVSLLTLVALALRLFHIGNESLWLDEAYTLLFSRLPVDRVVLVGGSHEHPPFYYLLVYVLLTIHDSPLMPRFIAAVAGALSVPTLYGLGSRLFSPVAGFIAQTLFVITADHDMMAITRFVSASVITNAITAAGTTAPDVPSHHQDTPVTCLLHNRALWRASGCRGRRDCPLEARPATA